MVFYRIAGTVSLLLLVVESVSASIPVAARDFSDGTGIVKRQSRTPRCPATDTQSPFFKTTLRQFKTYAKRADPKTYYSLLMLKYDLSDHRSCNARELPNTGSFVFWPIPPKGSSYCPRRDQEVRYRLFRGIQQPQPGALQLARLQNPNNFPLGDSAAEAKYCARNTVTYADFNKALIAIANAYSRVLDAVDYQTCLVGLNSQSVTAVYTLGDPEATGQDTKTNSIRRHLNLLFFYASFRNEPLNAEGRTIKAAIDARFDRTASHFANRRKCTRTALARCEELGIPLEVGLADGVVNLVGGEPVCNARKRGRI